MKPFLIIMLFALCNTTRVYAQSTLREFVIEKDDNPQVFYREKGCTPDDGVIVFYTTIPDLKFSMPDTPSRLKNVSTFDNENNCYVLCVSPTDARIGGISQYSISITAENFKPMPAFMVSGITAGIAQYFNILLKEDWKTVYESLIKEIADIKSENYVATGSIELKTVTSVNQEREENISAASWLQEGMNNSKVGN